MSVTMVKKRNGEMETFSPDKLNKWGAPIS